MPNETNNEHEIHDERSPLLNTATERDQRLGQEAVVSSESTYPLSRRRLIVALCLILIVLIEVASYLQVAPLNKIVEGIICHDYYPELELGGLSTGDESDPLCKGKDVQGELVMLRGWQSFFDYIPCLLTAIPYGFLADKYGRKFVLNLTVLGITLQFVSYAAICWWPSVFSVRLTWATAAFSLIGGGVIVFNAMIFTIVTDVASEEHRSSIYFYLGASVLTGELIASPIASALMTQNLWLPIFTGLGCMALANAIAFAIPETLSLRVSSKVTSDLASNEHESAPKSAVYIFIITLRAGLSHLTTAALRYIRRDRHIALLLFIFLITTLGRFAQEILLQFVTKRFNWTWAQAGLLLSLRAFSSLSLLVIILPASSFFLTKRLLLAPQTKDLWLARTSTVFLAAGAFGIGFSTSPIQMITGLLFFTLGSGFNLLIRSLLTSIVEPHHVGTLYSSIGFLEAIGSLVAGPLLSTTFKIGLELDGVWIGLPFIMVGASFTLSAIVVFAAKLPPPRNFGPIAADETVDQSRDT